MLCMSRIAWLTCDIVDIVSSSRTKSILPRFIKSCNRCWRLECRAVCPLPVNDTADKFAPYSSRGVGSDRQGADRMGLAGRGI